MQPIGGDANREPLMALFVSHVFYYVSLKEEGIDIFICNDVAVGIFI
jgi:hypothetical protein